MYNWVGESLAFVHLTPQPSIARLSTWTLTANIGPGFTIGLIPMALLQNPSPYSTSTPRGRCASLTHARYVTTLTTISLSAPFPMSGLEVSRWLVLSRAGWLPIGSLLRGKGGKTTLSNNTKVVLLTSGMVLDCMVFLQPPLTLKHLRTILRLKTVTLSWSLLPLNCIWQRMTALLPRSRSSTTPSPSLRACSLIWQTIPSLARWWAVMWKALCFTSPLHCPSL